LQFDHHRNASILLTIPTSLLCRSACGPFCELGLDQVSDQTPIALCEREFIGEASFQKCADTIPSIIWIFADGLVELSPRRRGHALCAAVWTIGWQHQTMRPIEAPFARRAGNDYDRRLYFGQNFEPRGPLFHL
jgi:hypothetical protein